MAMNGTALGDAIVAAMKVANPAITGTVEAELKTAFEAVGGAIVAYMVANTQVTVDATSSSNIKTNGTATTLPAGCIS